MAERRLVRYIQPHRPVISGDAFVEGQEATFMPSISRRVVKRPSIGVPILLRLCVAGIGRVLE